MEFQATGDGAGGKVALLTVWSEWKLDRRGPR